MRNTSGQAVIATVDGSRRRLLRSGVAVAGTLAMPAIVRAQSTPKIRIGFWPVAAGLPFFAAVEKGFFKEEGLDVSLVKCEWANYKDVLALGGYDVTHHLVMYFLKPIEQGLDVK
ncbi:MAG TPA: ABC transporter substrate-binding protein, partial [Bordetella sp.]|nr:ABC transporter substrate-binding protein [Bordetella sp.]